MRPTAAHPGCSYSGSDQFGCSNSRPNVANMDIISAGFLTLFNGAVAFVSTLASPVTLALVISAASLGWLARCEIEELDRRGTKPMVGRH